MKTRWACSLVVFGWLGGASGQDFSSKSPEEDPGRMGSTKGAEDRELTPAQRNSLIDKGRIAEQTWAHLVGLREHGNPHIRKGILLQNIKEEPGLTQVDTEKLRQEKIRQIERREYVPVVPAEPAPAVEAVKEPAPEPPAPRESGGQVVLVLGVGAMLAMAGMLVYLLRNRE